MAKAVAQRVTFLLFAAFWIGVPGANAADPAAKGWVLSKGRGITLAKDNTTSLTVDAQALTGSTGCNTFNAKIADRPGKRIAISDVAMTKKLCGQRENDVERGIVLAFSKTAFLKQEPGKLTFLSGKREPLLVWTEPVATKKVEGPLDRSLKGNVTGSTNRVVKKRAIKNRSAKRRSAKRLRAACARKRTRTARHHAAKRVHTARLSKRCRNRLRRRG